MKKARQCCSHLASSLGSSLTSAPALCKHSPGMNGESLLSIPAGDPGHCQSTEPREVSPGAEAGRAEEHGVSPCLNLPASSTVG